MWFLARVGAPDRESAGLQFDLLDPALCLDKALTSSAELPLLSSLFIPSHKLDSTRRPLATA